MDTTKTSDFIVPVPTGWSAVTGGGKHLISAMEYDTQGRLIQALGAKNVCVNTENQSIMTRSARWTIYDDVNCQITSANGFVEVDDAGNILSETLVNPITITISDITGRLLEAITARRISTSGKLVTTDRFLQTDYLSWNVNIYVGDQIVEKRDYFDIPVGGVGEKTFTITQPVTATTLTGNATL
ncbi:MAG: hypothetical protein Q4C70_09530 [Planctomycetia bacterium]|nr:hypothetical protein [Planctomycetia bacterium]